MASNPSLDAIWECMNIASRVGKQIENTEHLVPKSQANSINPVQDLAELTSTVNSVRTQLVPFVTSSKKTKIVPDQPFDLCISGIKDTLNDLNLSFKDLEKEFSIYTWKTQKVKIYQKDFLLKQKLDQFGVLFNAEDTKDKKAKDKHQITAFIADPEGKEMWVKSFGENTPLVPWAVFIATLEAFLQVPLKEDEESIKMFLDFTQDDHVSIFEFSVFLKWFGPLKGSCQRMLESLKGGLLCGFVPAVEANLLLEGKKEGTYLVRFSKTQPGSFAVTFVDHSLKIKHCLLYSVHPTGLSLKNPPTVYPSLKEFAEAHTNKLKHPLGNRWTLKKGLTGFQFDGKISEGLEETGTATSAASEGNTCVVCMDAPFETVFLECGHLACCTTCSQKLKLCPICRNVIARVVPIFRAV